MEVTFGATTHVRAGGVGILRLSTGISHLRCAGTVRFPPSAIRWWTGPAESGIGATGVLPSLWPASHLFVALTWFEIDRYTDDVHGGAGVLPAYGIHRFVLGWKPLPGQRHPAERDDVGRVHHPVRARHRAVFGGALFVGRWVLYSSGLNRRGTLAELPLLESVRGGQRVGWPGMAPPGAGGPPGSSPGRTACSDSSTSLPACGLSLPHLRHHAQHSVGFLPRRAASTGGKAGSRVAAGDLVRRKKTGNYAVRCSTTTRVSRMSFSPTGRCWRPRWRWSPSREHFDTDDEAGRWPSADFDIIVDARANGVRVHRSR